MDTSGGSGPAPETGGGVGEGSSSGQRGELTHGGGGGGADDVSQTVATSTTSSMISSASASPPSRYESQKRRDWNTFLQYLRNHKPPLSLSRCSGAHVIEFLKYLDQFGKTKVHITGCPYFGHPNPPAPCACPLKQAWGSLDALIGRLRAAYEENGGRPESNPFGARAVRIYLREVRESQAKARGIPYEKKKRKRTASSSSNNPPPTTITSTSASTATTHLTAPAEAEDAAGSSGVHGTSGGRDGGSGSGDAGGDGTSAADGGVGPPTTTT